MRWIVLTVLFTVHYTLFTSPARAQKFFNLTAEEVRIDTLLPAFHYAHPLGEHYADSTYSVKIVYPEFLPMSAGDIKRYQQLSGRPLGEMPEIYQSMSVSRKQGTLHIGFVPIVYRDGKFQKLVSFKLEVRGERSMVSGERRSRRTEGERYEYEMRVLIELTERQIPIFEARIAAVYIGANNTSHFKTVSDAKRVYQVIFQSAGIKRKNRNPKSG